MNCVASKLFSHSPSNDAPAKIEQARCELDSGHLGSHEGRAHGRRWFWNPHAHGIMRERSGYTRAMTKRGYSKDFTPHGDTGKRYLLDQIPAGLWADVKAKCKREGVSIRALILRLLRDWLGD